MMRHTVVAFLGSTGHTHTSPMDLSGWKSVAMVRRYRKVVDELRDALTGYLRRSERDLIVGPLRHSLPGQEY